MNENLINSFLEITSSSREEATFFLESHRWDLDAAVLAFLDNNAAAAAEPNSTGQPPQPLPSSVAAAPSPSQTPEYTPSETSPSTSSRAAPYPLRSRGGAEENKEGENPSGSRSTRSRQHAGNIRTFADLNRSPAAGEGSDSDTGDEKSGMVVQDPKKTKDVDALFDQARQSAVDRPVESSRSAPTSFTGAGRLLSGGEIVSSSPQQQQQDQPQMVMHTVTFWLNGFTVDDGPLRGVYDPENTDFMESIARSECPRELEPVDRKIRVHVDLVKRGENYTEPPNPKTPFQGVGRTLGASGSGSSSADAEPQAPSAPMNTAPAPSRGLVKKANDFSDKLSSEHPLRVLQEKDQRERVDIRVLPLELRRHVLSFLPTETGAVASLLMKTWKDEFACTSTLKFELIRGKDENQFIDFVNRCLAVRKEGDTDALKKFRLSISLEIDEQAYVNPWIEFALENCVPDLKICLYEVYSDEYELPHSIFISNFLVKLKIASGGFPPLIPSNVNVYLPSLRTLYLETVSFGFSGDGFHNLLAGCPAIEELIMEDIEWFSWVSSGVSSQSLKRLKIFWNDHQPEDERTSCPSNVSFSTPSLLQLDYMDDTAANYPQLDFSSLVEAKILLHLRGEEDDESAEEEDGLEVADDELGWAEEHATAFVGAICNVRKLYLYADTLQVLAFRCHIIPLFLNLSELVIESRQLSVWDSLPGLLINCPRLCTLVFRGLEHQARHTCGNVCSCIGDVVSDLAASPVRILEIFDLGQATVDRDRFVTHVRHFLVNMPHLQRIVVYCQGNAETRLSLSRTIRGIRGKASPMCFTQVRKCYT